MVSVIEIAIKSNLNFKEHLQLNLSKYLYNKNFLIKKNLFNYRNC